MLDMMSVQAVDFELALSSTQDGGSVNGALGQIKYMCFQYGEVS